MQCPRTSGIVYTDFTATCEKKVLFALFKVFFPIAEAKMAPFTNSDCVLDLCATQVAHRDAEHHRGLRARHVQDRRWPRHV